MAQEMTLTAYLAQRGTKAKALKRGEAEAFGIPYPLQAGWPARYAEVVITEAMISQAAANMAAPRRRAVASMALSRPTYSPRFPSFALRQARRYRSRKNVKNGAV